MSATLLAVSLATLLATAALARRSRLGDAGRWM
jgi:hypothetical protein